MTDGAGAVQVWHVRVDAARPQDAGLLSEDERQRATRLRRPEDARSFVAAHAALRRILAHETGIPARELAFVRQCRHCGGTGHGKPRLAARCPTVEFSLSHAGDHVLVAVAPEGIPVGVDVEGRARHVDWTAVSTAAFSRSEATELSRRPPREQPAAALGLWCRKEAVAKALGRGLHGGFSALDVGGSGEGWSVARQSGRDLGISVVDLALPGDVAGALAVGAPPTAVGALSPP